jgi:peptidoglycan hydrolase-like protein with peptidoglycan-binding domain
LLASIGTVFIKNNVATTTVQGKFVSNSITLELGNKSVIVAILQKELIAKGYLKEPATGVFDANTQAAVKAFQKAENLPVTGYVQVATSSLASLFAAAALPFVPIKIGATGVQANAVQSILINKGNLKIATTTAYFGTLTQSALKAFQASHGLPQTGIVDQATFAAMNGR